MYLRMWYMFKVLLNQKFIVLLYIESPLEEILNVQTMVEVKIS